MTNAEEYKRASGTHLGWGERSLRLNQNRAPGSHDSLEVYSKRASGLRIIQEASMIDEQAVGPKAPRNHKKSTPFRPSNT